MNEDERVEFVQELADNVRTHSAIEDVSASLTLIYFLVLPFAFGAAVWWEGRNPFIAFIGIATVEFVIAMVILFKSK